jgi:hypothetical protein
MTPMLAKIVGPAERVNDTGIAAAATLIYNVMHASGALF